MRAWVARARAGRAPACASGLGADRVTRPACRVGAGSDAAASDGAPGAGAHGADADAKPQQEPLEHERAARGAGSGATEEERGGGHDIVAPMLDGMAPVAGLPQGLKLEAHVESASGAAATAPDISFAPAAPATSGAPAAEVLVARSLMCEFVGTAVVPVVASVVSEETAGWSSPSQLQLQLRDPQLPQQHAPQNISEASIDMLSESTSPEESTVVAAPRIGGAGPATAPVEAAAALAAAVVASTSDVAEPRAGSGPEPHAPPGETETVTDDHTDSGSSVGPSPSGPLSLPTGETGPASDSEASSSSASAALAQPDGHEPISNTVTVSESHCDVSDQQPASDSGLMRTATHDEAAAAFLTEEPAAVAAAAAALVSLPAQVAAAAAAATPSVDDVAQFDDADPTAVPNSIAAASASAAVATVPTVPGPADAQRLPSIIIAPDGALLGPGDVSISSVTDAAASGAAHVLLNEQQQLCDIGAGNAGEESASRLGTDAAAVQVSAVESGSGSGTSRSLASDALQASDNAAPCAHVTVSSGTGPGGHDGIAREMTGSTVTLVNSAVSKSGPPAAAESDSSKNAAGAVGLYPTVRITRRQRLLGIQAAAAAARAATANGNAKTDSAVPIGGTAADDIVDERESSFDSAEASAAAASVAAPVEDINDVIGPVGPGAQILTEAAAAVRQPAVEGLNFGDAAAGARGNDVHVLLGAAGPRELDVDAPVMHLVAAPREDFMSGDVQERDSGLGDGHHAAAPTMRMTRNRRMTGLLAAGMLPAQPGSTALADAAAAAVAPRSAPVTVVTTGAVDQHAAVASADTSGADLGPGGVTEAANTNCYTGSSRKRRKVSGAGPGGPGVNRTAAVAAVASAAAGPGALQQQHGDSEIARASGSGSRSRAQELRRTVAKGARAHSGAVKSASKVCTYR